MWFFHPQPSTVLRCVAYRLEKDFEEEGAVGKFEFYFGRVLSDIEWLRLTGLETALERFHLESPIVRLRFSAVGALTVRGSISDGVKDVYEVKRSYYRDEHNRRFTVHDFQQMAGKLQDSDHGWHIFQQTLKEYRKYRITLIRLWADGLGQYVWPSFGFELECQFIDEVLEELASWLVMQDYFGLGTYDDGDPLELARDVVADFGIVSISELAKFADNSSGVIVRLGREFLQWRGRGGHSDLQLIYNC